MSGDFSQVATTVDTADSAEAMARGIVEARLAACVHIVGPITSVYRWDGQVQADQEWQCIAKTTADRADALIGHIKANHSYDVPEVVVTRIEGGNPDYLGWIDEQTRP